MLISRAEARAAGLARYFTGKPCARGHVCERTVRKAECVECRAAQAARHYQRHHDQVRERQSAYAQENRAKVNAMSRDWYHSCSQAKAVRREQVRARRAAKAHAVPGWFGELDAFVVAEADHLAQQRAERFGFEWHVDHMIPIRAKRASGLHCAANLQVIPAHINTRKNNRMILTEPLEWLPLVCALCAP